MTNKEMQSALLNKTLVTYDDGYNIISDVKITSIMLKNVSESLTITSVEIADKNGKTVYNVLPKYLNEIK